MRTFYTGSDIEDLAARGVRQLELGPGVALTDTARELAEELGIALVLPGSAPARKPAATASTAKSGALPTRPKGCQHGPLTAKPGRIEAASSGSTVVEQLVEAVSALKKRGG
jgi:hypothetical protein